MKFIVWRTSAPLDRPCDGALQQTVTWRQPPATGKLGVPSQRQSRVEWVIDVDDVARFARQHGPVIIGWGDYDLPLLEIYDARRESQ